MDEKTALAAENQKKRNRDGAKIGRQSTTTLPPNIRYYQGSENLLTILFFFSFYQLKKLP